MQLAVVDDDTEVTGFVRDAMRQFGHRCEDFATATKLLAALRRETFDVLLLDWHLPDMSGLDLLVQIRADRLHTTGIIMLTNRSDEDAVTTALRSGADDFIIKPESGGVIAARVEAVHRRFEQGAQKERYFHFGGYEFDRLTKNVVVAGAPVAVNAKEFALALLFFENIHRPLSRRYILETVWHADPNLPTRTLDMHVSRLRTKLQLRPERGYRIAAISSYGYRLEWFSEGERR